LVIHDLPQLCELKVAILDGRGRLGRRGDGCAGGHVRLRKVPPDELDVVCLGVALRLRPNSFQCKGEPERAYDGKTGIQHRRQPDLVVEERDGIGHLNGVVGRLPASALKNRWNQWKRTSRAAHRRCSGQGTWPHGARPWRTRPQRRKRSASLQAPLCRHAQNDWWTGLGQSKAPQTIIACTRRSFFVCFPHHMHWSKPLVHGKVPPPPAAHTQPLLKGWSIRHPSRCTRRA